MMASSANLGQQLESYVTDLVKNGRYNSRSEVLREGVRLVEEREKRLAACASRRGSLRSIDAPGPRPSSHSEASAWRAGFQFLGMPGVAAV